MIDIVNFDQPIPIKPRRSAFNRWFWESLQVGRFETSCCENCGRLVFPPRPDCPECLKRKMAWQELSGFGNLYTRTTIRAVPERLIEFAPLPVGIIDLREGVRMVCMLLEGEDPIAIGAEVKVVALQYTDGVLFGVK